MSNVIKDTEGFIPKDLVPDHLDQPAVWGEFTKKIEAYQKQAVPQEKIHKNATEAYTEDSEQHIEKEQQFDTDFSAPVLDADPDSSASSPPGEDQPPQMPDLELLAEESFNKGVQAGIERMESDYGTSIKTLQSVCEHLNEIRDLILKNSMDEMKDLVLTISEKIIRHSVATQKDTIEKVVEESIQQAVKSDEFIISVNPEDYDVIQSKSNDFVKSISGLENIIIRSDAKVEQGGCIVESSNCTVDATLVSQLDIIADYLKKS